MEIEEENALEECVYLLGKVLNLEGLDIMGVEKVSTDTQTIALERICEVLKFSDT